MTSRPAIGTSLCRQPKGQILAIRSVGKSGYGYARPVRTVPWRRRDNLGKSPAIGGSIPGNLSPRHRRQESAIRLAGRHFVKTHLRIRENEIHLSADQRFAVWVKHLAGKGQPIRFFGSVGRL